MLKGRDFKPKKRLDYSMCHICGCNLGWELQVFAFLVCQAICSPSRTTVVYDAAIYSSYPYACSIRRIESAIGCDLLRARSFLWSLANEGYGEVV
jgi:hypothetical protein